MKIIFVLLISLPLFLSCQRKSKAGLSHGYNGCKIAAEHQSEHLRRGEKEKFRYMMLDKQTFMRVVYPRLVGFKGTNAEDVWNLTAFEIERSTDRAFEELKGSTTIHIGEAKNVEEHKDMKIFRNFEMVIGNGVDAKGAPISQRDDKILSALVEIDGICRHWVNAYKD